MRIFAKPGKPARIELTSHEKRVLNTASEICFSVGQNSIGDLKQSATEGCINLKNVLQHLGGEAGESS